MAGGPNAASMFCLQCAGRADRTGEGIEDDQYRCLECGYTFGVDWSEGEPVKPCWSTDAAARAAAEKNAALFREMQEKIHPKTPPSGAQP